MRVSGAIKSILHGVTRQNLVNADSVYFKDQINTIPRVDEGLTKRPPAEFVTSMGASLASDGTEFVKDFTINDVAYLLIVRTTGMTVYREDGTTYAVVDGSDTTYLDGITEDDMELAVHGESIFVLNKTKSVLMQADDSQFLTHSLLWIKGPIEYSTQIWVTATDNAGTPITKIYAVPASGIQNTGADAVCKQIALLFNADINFTSTNRGATLNILKTNGESAEITCSTSIGEENIVVMNGTVDSVNDLPRYAYDGCITKVQVREDASKADFYMEAEAIASYDQVADVPPTWPTATLVNKTPVWGTYIGTTFTPKTPDGTSRYYLAIDNPGSIDGKTVDILFLQRLEAHHNGDTSKSDEHVAVKYNVGQVPDAGDHVMRFALNATPDTTVYQVWCYAQYNSQGNYWWWTSYYMGTPTEIFTAGVAIDIWADPEVDNAGTAGDLVEVRWEERSKPGIERDFKANTMPHVIIPNGAEDFSLEAVTWDARSAGDDDNNPVPAFVTKQVQDIAIFQDRLCLLSGDEVSMSASRNTFNFFRDTTTQLLSKHPINVRSTSARSSKFHHFVNHNRDLMIIAGRAQFKIAGEQPITPQTAAMPLTTQYNASETVSPVSIGNSIYMPSAHGTFLNISKYDGATRNLTPDSADNITAHVRKYIPGTATAIYGFPNHGLLFVNDSSDNALYVCNYDTELTREEDHRFAWFKWNDLTDKAYTIRRLATSKNTLLLAVDTALGIQMLKMDLDAGADKIYLDYIGEHTSVTTTIHVGTSYGVSLSDIKVVQGAGCPNPGDYVETTTLVSGTLTLAETMGGGTVYAGREFDVQVEPNLLTVRDEGGHILKPSDLRVQGFTVSLVDTGYMEATEQSPYDTYDTQEFSGLISNDLDTITDTAVTTTNDFQIGFKQKADVGTILLTSKSWLPMTITQIDWRGNYTSRGRRF